MNQRWNCAVAAFMTALLAGCGGGGGGGGGASTPASASTTPPADAIVPSAFVAQRCAAPRTGTDPATGRAYPDRQGSLADEKAWVRAYIDETYLWWDEVPATLRAADYATPQSYFGALKTPALTPSGAAKDRFRFTNDSAAWAARSIQGQAAGYGFEVALVRSTPPRDVRVAYTEPGSPAAAAGLARGARILAVDGVDVGAGASTELNAALFPSAAGQPHVLVVQDSAASGTRTVNLSSALITSTPVQNVKVLDTAAGKTGYLLFNEHVATAEAQLVSAMRTFQSAGVRELVIDMRYNGGGLLSVASRLATMVAAPQALAGKFFEKLQFNAKNPFGLSDADTITPFYATTSAYSPLAGQPLPQLALSRVTVISGADTCSASESVVNGLRGAGVQVDLIGATTCGKPYGFFAQDNCGTTYFAIQFKGVNAQGFGDYGDGFAPTCSVADDLDRALGEPSERRLAAALAYRATGVCPAALASGLGALQSKQQPDDTAAPDALRKPRLRSERILR